MSAYAQRVHRVVDHIRRHLADDLRLDELAKVAHFSAHHFHRIFKAEMGETVAAFTRRARLERAVYLMRGSPLRDLTSIALEVGFSTPSDFSRVFRSHFGMAPSAWDRSSRLDDAVDFVGADLERSSFDVRVVERQQLRLVYVRVRDPWRGSSLADGYGRLIGWLDSQNIAWRRRHLVGMSWDSDKATPLDKLVYDLGFDLPDVAADDAFGVIELPAVRSVEISCSSLRQTALAWEQLYRDWLPRSGYEPADLPAMKRFRHAPEVFDANAWNVDCSIALTRQHVARS